jgi:hypothetical protein
MRQERVVEETGPDAATSYSSWCHENGMCEQMNEWIYNLQVLLERLLLRRVQLVQYSIGPSLSVGILLGSRLCGLCFSR